MVESDQGIVAEISEVDIVALDLHDQRAEVGAPVADVVVANEIGSAEIEEARNCLADDHRTQVADVGLFCGVGARVVDDDFMPVLQFLRAALVVGFARVGELPVPDKLGREFEVNKTGAGQRKLDEFGIKLTRGLGGID